MTKSPKGQSSGRARIAYARRQQAIGPLELDDRKVAIVLKELSDIITLDFEIDATGFEAPEIDLRIQSLEPPDESTDSADEFEVTQGSPVSRPDDLWTLGDPRLLCGNALDPQACDALLAGEKAAAVFTDPTDGVRVKDHVSGKGAKEHHEIPGCRRTYRRRIQQVPC
jgi:hypothetical protein